MHVPPSRRTRRTARDRIRPSMQPLEPRVLLSVTSEDGEFLPAETPAEPGLEYTTTVVNAPASPALSAAKIRAAALQNWQQLQALQAYRAQLFANAWKSWNAASVSIEITGTLDTEAAAIGGETTGVTLTTDAGFVYELNLQGAAARQFAQTLNGQRVTVKGNLHVVKGVEIPFRNIIGVTSLFRAPGPQTVQVTGVLNAQAGAIGGETTGIEVTTPNGTRFELVVNRQAANALHGKRVTVKGTLHIITGTEVPTRKVILATSLQLAASLQA